MSAETRCWLQRPLTTDKTSTYRGEVRSKRLVAAETQAPVTVETLAQSLASSCWYRRTVSEGTKGPIAYAFARKRVTLSKEGLPDRSVWLVIKRTLGAEPTYWYYLSNAPESTPLRLFVWLSGVRWSIEQGFEETKTELGMAHYEGRTYPGWYHHMLTCMLAHFFLWHLKIRWGKKSPRVDGVPGTDLAGSALALAHIHGRRGPRAGRMGPAVQSPGVFVAQKAS
jgi:SRSO17 transposase